MNYQEYEKELKRALEMEKESQEQIDLVNEISDIYGLNVTDILEDLQAMETDKDEKFKNTQLKQGIIFED